MKYSYYYIETEIGSEFFKDIILPDSEIEKDKRYKIVYLKDIFEDNIESIINFIEYNPCFIKSSKIQKILNCEFINENLKRKIKLYLNLKGDNNV
ncbi:hypothetical protein [Fusobacterium polymorphum]|uniref:hypothetical protein n=1 Tax=Fusobacterium nucleatum subsp. polymorphum TaxID=76857 RepID=UPI00300A8B68